MAVTGCERFHLDDLACSDGPAFLPNAHQAGVGQRETVKFASGAPSDRQSVIRPGDAKRGRTLRLDDARDVCSREEHLAGLLVRPPP